MNFCVYTAILASFSYRTFFIIIQYHAFKSATKKYLGHTCFILNKTPNASNFFPCCPFYFFY